MVVDETALTQNGVVNGAAQTQAMVEETKQAQTGFGEVVNTSPVAQ